MSRNNLEKKLSYGTVLPALKSLDALRVENGMVGAGTPDINFIEGWVELKALEEWPVRPDTAVNVHIRPDQRVWLRTRWHRGGVALLLLKVYSSKTCLVLDGHTAAVKLGTLNRAELLATCLWSYEGQQGLNASMLRFFSEFRRTTWPRSY